MAEFCLDCWNKIMDTKDTKRKFVMSRDLELCEECGEWKSVIVAVKWRYIVKEWFEEWISVLRERKKQKNRARNKL